MNIFIVTTAGYDCSEDQEGLYLKSKAILDYHEMCKYFSDECRQCKDDCLGVDEIEDEKDYHHIVEEVFQWRAEYYRCDYGGTHWRVEVFRQEL